MEAAATTPYVHTQLGLPTATRMSRLDKYKLATRYFCSD